MSYNLRHRTEEEAPSANTMSKAAIASIEAKLDLLLKGKEETDSKLSLIIEKMSSTEKEICALKEKVDNLESFANSASKEIQDLRDEVQQKNKQIEDLETIFHKVDDLENRSKRNNLVIWNIPERAEEGKSCEEFVKEFIGNHMNMPNAEAIEIERAHRTPPSRSFGNSMKPRPIHVKFLRYGNRQMVLKNAKLHTEEKKYSYPMMSQRKLERKGNGSRIITWTKLSQLQESNLHSYRSWFPLVLSTKTPTTNFILCTTILWIKARNCCSPFGVTNPLSVVLRFFVL